MAKYFSPNQLSPRKVYEQKYKTARTNLWLVVLFTAINLLLLVTNANTYFLFSASIPYILVSAGMLMCGFFPEEYYTGEFYGMTFLDSYVFIILLVVAVAFTLLYLLAWFLSKNNRVGWLIFALVFFCLDTIGMIFIGGISLESAFDILFHGWVIFSLSIGIHAHYKLKQLTPDETPAPAGEDTNSETSAHTADPVNSFVLRDADVNVKQKILLKASVLNYDICYRRVKHTNELVINGKVYDEVIGVLEYPHVLKANVDGHYICAGFTGTHSFINVDNEEIAKKLRLI